MKTVITNDQLLTIRQIKDITSIEYKDIFLNVANGEKQLVPGFIITYGNSNTIMFLTTIDPYFDEYVRKIREVYLLEKDHVIRDGIRGKEYIKIDPLTKEMLLNGNIEKTAAMYEEYATAESYQESLLMEEDRLKAHFSIIEYHLKEVLKRFNKTITHIECSEGVNGVYFIKALIDNSPVIIPMHFEEQEDSWKVILGNLLENAIPIQMEGLFTKNGIMIQTTINEYGYSDYSAYTVKENKIMSEREVHLQDRLIHYETKQISPTTKIDPVTVYEMDSSSYKVVWYALPWNAYIGLYEDKWYMREDGTRTEEEQPERMVQNKIIYLSKTEDSFYLKEIASKRYHRKIDDRTLGGNIELDHMNKRRIGLISKDGVLVETHFSDGGVTGKYKEVLSGNYFYQIYGKDLKKEQAKFIDHEQGLEEKSDLFDVKKYIKREDA